MNEAAFTLSIRLIAEALHVELDDIRYHREVALADESSSIAAGVIEKGTVAAMKMHLDGIRAGKVLIALEYVWRVSDDVAPEWPSGSSRWLLTIDGDPRVESEVLLSTTHDSGRATSLAVATLTLNAVPVVCAVPPGPIKQPDPAPARRRVLRLTARGQAVIEHVRIRRRGVDVAPHQPLAVDLLHHG